MRRYNHARNRLWQYANIERTRRQIRRIAEKDFEEIKKSQGYCCKICDVREGTIFMSKRKKLFELKLTQDHIVPLSKGGKNVKENVQALCYSCNQAKADKRPEPMRAG